MEERQPQLLDLISSERSWSVKNRGRERDIGVGETEEKLELRLGLPGTGEDWCRERKREDGVSVNVKSLLSLGSFSKVANGNTNSSPSGGNISSFLGASENNPQGLVKSEKQSMEREVGGANATLPPNNSSQTRAASTTVVGWPPVRSFRRNLACSHKQLVVQSQNTSLGTGSKIENNQKGLFVKINMDGIPIGRKVDLKAYDSYDKLSLAVDQLFRGLLAAQKADIGNEKNVGEKTRAITGLLDGSGEYTLVYEDDEGDKMLVGDVPWEMFVSTAKRLRVLKSSDLSASSLRTVCRKRAATEC